MRLNLAAIPAAAVLASLIGCAPATRAPAKPAPVVDTKAPRCVSTRQCEAMWVDAQSALETYTGMRLRLVTDARIETFAPTGYGRMGGVVVKYPVGESAYEFRVTFECYRSTDCTDLRAAATNGFNLHAGGPASMPSR